MPLLPGSFSASNRVIAIESEFAEQAAEANFEAILRDAPWLKDLPQLLDAICNENASLRVRYRKLCALADRVNQAIGNHSACASGCSACCHIAVSVSPKEAQLLGAAIGRTPVSVTGRLGPSGESVRYFGAPCSFLAGDACSIYEHRPIPCRLHANIGHSPFFCSVEVDPEDSVVPNIDLRVFDLFYTKLFGFRDGLADLREFFPGESELQRGYRL